MKRSLTLARVTACVAAVSFASLSFAQPPPGGPDFPGKPGDKNKKKPIPGVQKVAPPKKPGGGPVIPKGSGGPITPKKPGGLVIPGKPGGPGPLPPITPPRPPRPPRDPLTLIIPPPPPVVPRTRVVHSKSESYADSIVGQVQRKLKKLGYYTDKVDGEIGEHTRAAIRAYQEENNLEITGKIDKALLSSLEL